MKTNIPIVDLGLSEPGAQTEHQLARISSQLHDAMAISGFFYIKNHGIPATALAILVEQTKAFFAAPASVRESIPIDRNNRGYLAQGEARMLGAQLHDLKEVFFFGRELSPDDPDIKAGVAMCAMNQWPDQLPRFRTGVLDYLAGATVAGSVVLQGFAQLLGVSNNFFDSRYTRPMSRGQLIHYPKPAPDASRDQFGVAAHTDFGCITLLYQHTPGLEVQGRDGQWIAVPPIPDTLVVNIGDLLERWSAGSLPSTRHRVRNQTGDSRYSIAIFYDPEPTAIVDPADLGHSNEQYPPVTAADYILGRSKKVFAQYDDSIRETKRSDA